jgi:ArsR family transcriptional regulator
MARNMPKDNYEQYLRLFRALANDDRIKILKLLVKNPLPAQEIEKLFFMEQSTASYHLNNMRRAGLLSCTKDGKRAIYSYIPGSLEKIFSSFNEVIRPE